MALTILAVAVVTLIQLSSQSLRLAKNSGDHQQAVLVADRIASQTQATDEGLDNGQEGPFRWERRISLVPMPEEFKPKQIIPGTEPVKFFAVTIDVHWGANNTVELATLRTPTSMPPPPAQATTPGTQTNNPTTGTPTSPTTAQPTSPTSTGGIGTR